MFALGFLIGQICYPLLSDIIGRRKLLCIIFAIGVGGMSMLLISI